MMTECWSEARSGKDGRYRLYTPAGVYDVQVRVPESGVARQKATIAADEAKAMDITLVGGTNFIARVVDSITGAPVPGVRLWNWQYRGIEGTSNAAGNVAILNMMPGSFQFQVEAKGYARWWSEACSNAWSRFQKADRHGFQRNLDGLDFEIKPGMEPVTIMLEQSATFRGRVVDPDGKPVTGATVAPALTGSGNSLTGDSRYSVETDHEGRFDAPMPASGDRDYNLIAHDGKIFQWRTWANGVLPPVRTKPGQVIDGLLIRLTRPATVTGRVMDASGKPVADREVRSEPTDKSENRYYDPTTKTRADGTFELKFIRASEQFIQCAPFWLYAEQAPAGATVKVTLAPGETRAGVELKAQPQR
jgi:hypothetical protein